MTLDDRKIKRKIYWVRKKKKKTKFVLDMCFFFSSYGLQWHENHIFVVLRCMVKYVGEMRLSSKTNDVYKITTKIIITDRHSSEMILTLTRHDI